MRTFIVTILALMATTISAYSLPTQPDCSSGEEVSLWYSESQKAVVETHCIPRLETKDGSPESYLEAKKAYLQVHNMSNKEYTNQVSKY